MAKQISVVTPPALLTNLRRLLLHDSVSTEWIRRGGIQGFARPIVVLVFAAAAYGAAMGLWRAPTLALYVALKAPLLLLAVASVNALVNAAFAVRTGLGLTFAETLRTVLIAFMLAALLLAALAPVFLFFSLVLDIRDDEGGRRAHDLLGLAHISAIALAGTVATLRQRVWIQQSGASAARSRTLVAIWLSTNLLAGAQISWVLRPWFGTPSLEVAFLRAHPFDGTFYESVLHMILPH